MTLFRRFDLLDPLASTACLYSESAFSTPPFPCSAAAPPPPHFLVDDLLLLAEFTPHVDILHHRHHHHYLSPSVPLVDVLTPDLSLQCPFLAQPSPAPLAVFDAAADLIRVDRAETRRALRSLEDRVAALELGLTRRYHCHPPPPAAPRDRTYKWTAERADRQYKCVAQAKAGGETSVKWTTELGGKGKGAGLSKTYTFEVSSSPATCAGGKKKATKAAKKCSAATRVVEITDGQRDPGTVLLRKTFAKRAASRNKGKWKELSPQEAAYIIQVNFRQYLIRRSQTLRGLRDLAVAKAKLKEIRALFSNFSYGRRLIVDAEERQRFSEKIIVLLLTVDAIEGPDYIVRTARKSMIEELEAMLDVVDPQPSSSGRLGSLKRRKFDLPETSSAVQKELAFSVSQVVRLLDEVESV